MLELLMPAGNLNKLKCAFHFGADAVYLGGKNFSLRAFADNFSYDEIAEGVKYAHSLGKKAYVTANIFARDSETREAAEFFAFLQDVEADAALISDLGLFALCREVAPSLAVHISTQANATNSRTVQFYASLGAKRVVLARELTLNEIAFIHSQCPQVELEAFCHGAMCMSYSGRCLLSSYLAGRSANRGECAQPCRWSYTLIEEKRSDEPLTLQEDAHGSYILNSRDLKLISRIPELAKAGVCSLKVEGRMKSEFYVATVATAYRKAIDEYLTFGEIRSAAELDAQLERASHRPYTQGFFDGKTEDMMCYDSTRTPEKEIFVAETLDWKDGVATVEMRNRFRSGDVLNVLSPTSCNGERIKVGAIVLAADGSVTDDAKLVQSAYKFDCPIPLTRGDLLTRDNA